MSHMLLIHTRPSTCGTCSMPCACKQACQSHNTWPSCVRYVLRSASRRVWYVVGLPRSWTVGHGPRAACPWDCEVVCCALRHRPLARLAGGESPRGGECGVPGGAASGDGEGGASLLRESGESQSPRSSCSIGFEQYEGSQNTRNEGTHGLIDIRN